MKLIPLTGNKGMGSFAKVSDEDFERLSKYKWYMSESGYAQRTKRIGLRKDNKHITLHMHREIMQYQFGILPGTSIFTDHINNNRLDNQRNNLRLATKRQNAFNRSKGRVSKAGYRGVRHAHTKGKFWAVSVDSEGNKQHIGTFDSALEASIAYKNYIKQEHGEFAYVK